MKHLKNFNDNLTNEDKSWRGKMRSDGSACGWNTRSIAQTHGVRLGKHLGGGDEMDELEGILRSMASSNPNDADLGQEVRRLIETL